MKSQQYLLSVLVTIASCHFFCGRAKAEIVEFGNDCTIEFLSAENAAIRLQTPDLFTKATAGLERQIRLQSEKPVSEMELLAFASEQAVAWNENEIEVCRTQILSLAAAIEKLKLHVKFPSKIEFIKTTGNEEGGAAYCRGNAVVFSAKVLKTPPEGLRSLIAHELFHVFSRTNPDTRDKLFQIIGFKRCGVLMLPEKFAARRLTNPDAPILEHFMQIEQDDESVNIVPVTYLSVENFEPGNMFKFLKFDLIAIESPQAGEQVAAKINDNGRPIFIAPSNNTFHKQIGRNTNYVIHPEEIMADNFSMLVTEKSEIPDPWITEKIAAILREKQSTDKTSRDRTTDFQSADPATQDSTD
ncbi:MAG: hypothetical protein KDB27_17535 [Planctomycetales bacterium]|nr:hypothetical protein [Planctomycetales bacterium]